MRGEENTMRRDASFGTCSVKNRRNFWS